MTDDEKKPYHKILIDTWRMFIKNRVPETFSDKWWEEIISEFDTYVESYKDSKYYDFCAYLSRTFLDEWERLGNDR